LFQESNLNTFELYNLKQDNKLVFDLPKTWTV